jgi:hypothetical protein
MLERETAREKTILARLRELSINDSIPTTLSSVTAPSVAANKTLEAVCSRFMRVAETL